MGSIRTSTVSISDAVRDHFERPRHAGSLNVEDPSVGTGIAGSPARGVVIRLQIRLADSDVIEAVRFKAHGCVSAIAASSRLCEMLPGLSLADASRIEQQALVQSLDLPVPKVHCAVLALQALAAAIRDAHARREEQAAGLSVSDRTHSAN